MLGLFLFQYLESVNVGEGFDPDKEKKNVLKGKLSLSINHCRTVWWVHQGRGWWAWGHPLTLDVRSHTAVVRSLPRKALSWVLKGELVNRALGRTNPAEKQLARPTSWYIWANELYLNMKNPHSWDGLIQGAYQPPILKSNLTVSFYLLHFCFIRVLEVNSYSLFYFGSFPERWLGVIFLALLFHWMHIDTSFNCWSAPYNIRK